MTLSIPELFARFYASLHSSRDARFNDCVEKCRKHELPGEESSDDRKETQKEDWKQTRLSFDRGQTSARDAREGLTRLISRSRVPRIYDPRLATVRFRLAATVRSSGR